MQQRGMVWVLTLSIKRMGIVTCSLIADEEVYQGRLQDPRGEKGRRLLLEARGTGRGPTQKTGWFPFIILHMYMLIHIHTHTRARTRTFTHP